MNRLKNETSPYLLQHAGNPVDWYPWGDEAFDTAAMHGKPVLLSIGYSSCHWCHVMERESFTDNRTALKMNSDFINIKVDREERPDIDHIYMQAVQAVTGRGGWPMTVFLLPDRRPFFGGTYFPPEPRLGLPSFLQVLESVSNAYRYRLRDVEQAALNIANALKGGHPRPSGEKKAPGEGILHSAFQAVEKGFDRKYGGMAGAPKFPNPMIIEYLLGYGRMSGRREPLDFAVFTLDMMRRGGIYDQAGGGFHRYSVDGEWLVPHFEKMLYDNALLSRLYLHAWQASGKGFLKVTAEEIYDYILREMAAPGGGFYSSTDADTEGAEGKFFLWDAGELMSILGADYGLAAHYWGIDRGPNFEGMNILHVPHEEGEVETKFGIPPEDLRERMRAVRERLRRVRETRVRPGLDDKIVTSWSAMMTASLAEASRILARADYREAAVKGGRFIIQRLSSWEGGLRHTWKNGTGKINGFLDDYGAAIDACIELYQTTWDETWLTWAFRYADHAIRSFRGDDGLFYDTGNREEGLFMRPRNLQDTAVPSGNSAMARQLIRLWGYGGDTRYIRNAEKILGSMEDLITVYPVYFGEALNALILTVTGMHAAVIIGDPEGPLARGVASGVNGAYRPEMITALSPADAGDDDPVPVLRGRGRVNGRDAAYFCRGTECSLPLTDPGEAVRYLAGDTE